MHKVAQQVTFSLKRGWDNLYAYKIILNYFGTHLWGTTVACVWVHNANAIDKRVDVSAKIYQTCMATFEIQN